MCSGICLESSSRYDRTSLVPFVSVFIGFVFTMPTSYLFMCVCVRPFVCTCVSTYIAAHHANWWGKKKKKEKRREDGQVEPTEQNFFFIYK